MSQNVNPTDSDDVAESLDAFEPEADTGDLSELKPKFDPLAGDVENMDDLEPEEAEETVARADIAPEDESMEAMEEELDEEAEAEEDNTLLNEVDRKLRAGESDFLPTDFSEDDEEELEDTLDEAA